MRHHYIQPTEYTTKYGELYFSNHPLYANCTLYRHGDIGLAVVQQHFSTQNRIFFYGPIYPWLVDAIYEHPGFETYFSQHAGKCKDGVYPTVLVRKLMWALRMKPLPKEWWEQELQGL